MMLALLATLAAADPMRAVRPIPGYACASLVQSEREAMDSRPGAGVPIRTAPSASAPVDGLAPSVLFVKQPREEVGGFVAVLQYNGKPGWIERGRVKPFDPLARCVPSWMSDGKPGIG